MFIQVIGNSLDYNHKSFLNIPISRIKEAHPIFAVRAKGDDYFRCTSDHKNAELLGFKLKCNDDAVYSCYDQSELEKIGLTLKNKPSNGIGFIIYDTD